MHSLQIIPTHPPQSTPSTHPQPTMSSYPNDISVCKLDATQAFAGLSAKEK